ncbi:MAG: YihY/virulence factor BrkB family protein [Chitinophagaceae bacterium]|nr:YihY/virulence factor BrkB family protein [Chitinophagaceae bacterium]
MTRIEYYIIRSKPVQAIIHWLKRIVLPGFEGVSLFDSLNFFRKEIFSNRFNGRANAVSFSFLMAMPPLLLFFFTLVPYLPLQESNLIGMIDNMLILISPGDKIQQSISAIIKDFITHKKTVLLSFSVLLTIFYSSNGMMGLMNSFDKQMPGFKNRNGVKKRMIAIALTFLLIFAIVLTLTFMIVQAWVASGLGIEFLQSLYYLKFIAYVLIIAVCFITVSFIYRFGSATVTKIKFINPGSVIATLLIISLTVGFFYVVNNLVNYDKIYGSIGTLIIFLIWVNFMAQILLIGFELNASIVVHRIKINAPKTKNNGYE